MQQADPSLHTAPATGQIIVLSGPSGVGKGTICQRLLNKAVGLTTPSSFPRLVLSISVTSRPPRSGETDGESYTFVSRQQFESMIASRSFLEWAEYNGHYYGTPGAVVLEKLAQGTSVLLEIEVRGALQVKASHPEAQLIFIAPPSGPTSNPVDVLRARLYGRGNTPEAEIERRLGISVHELTQQNQFDHIVINETVETCSDQLMALLNLLPAENNTSS